MKNSCLRLIGLVALWLASFLAGCWSQPGSAALRPNEQTTGATFEAALAHASASNQPLILLVADLGESRADDEARALVQSYAGKNKGEGVTICVMDISISRNRALASRFHAIETPLLLCISARGLIISRDEQPLAKSLLSNRIEEAIQRAPELDQKLARLENSAAKNPNDTAAQSDLADFLLEQRNALEAIPHLAKIAHSETNDLNLRVHSWVSLARAHLWIGEPEKARHEAQQLIATLGNQSLEARAGGTLILGIHDANLKRPALARQEFEEVIGLAPESSYAKEAGQMLIELRKGWKVK